MKINSQKTFNLNGSIQEETARDIIIELIKNGYSVDVEVQRGQGIIDNYNIVAKKHLSCADFEHEEKWKKWEVK